MLTLLFSSPRSRGPGSLWGLWRIRSRDCPPADRPGQSIQLPLVRRRARSGHLKTSLGGCLRHPRRRSRLPCRYQTTDARLMPSARSAAHSVVTSAHRHQALSRQLADQQLTLTSAARSHLASLQDRLQVLGDCLGGAWHRRRWSVRPCRTTLKSHPCGRTPNCHDRG